MKGVRTRLWLARLELSVTSLRAAASHRQPAAPICKHLTPKTSRHTLEQSQQRAASHPHRRPSPRPSPKGANLCSPRARAGARRGRQISRGYWTWILRKPVFEPPPGFNLPQRSCAFRSTSPHVRARLEPPHARCAPSPAGYSLPSIRLPSRLPCTKLTSQHQRAPPERPGSWNRNEWTH